MSRGSIPPDHGSVNIEMFVPSNRGCYPFQCKSICLEQWATCDHTDRCSPHDIRAVQGTGRRNLPSDPQSTDTREEAHMQFHPVVPQRGTVPYGGPSHWVWKSCQWAPWPCYRLLLDDKIQGRKACLLRRLMKPLSTCKRSRQSMVGHELDTLLSCFGIPEQDEWLPHRKQQSHWGITWLHLDGSIEGDGGCWKAHGWWLGNHYASCGHASHHPATLVLPVSWYPGLTGFAPEVYAAQPRSRMDILDFSHVPPLQSNQRACMYYVKRLLRMPMVQQIKRRQFNQHGCCPWQMYPLLV